MLINTAALRVIREARGITQAQAAGRCGVAQATWSKWELGMRFPTPAKIRLIGVALALDDLTAILFAPTEYEIDRLLGERHKLTERSHRR